MNNKELIKYIVVIGLGFVLAYFLGLLYIKIQYAAANIIYPEYDIYRALECLVLTVFGILIEWKALFDIRKKRTISIGCLLGACILIIFPMIPFVTMTNYFGIPTVHSFKGMISLLYSSPYSRSLASILGGIILIRSFKKE